MVEIYGQEASGKTILALHIVKEAQNLGGLLRCRKSCRLRLINYIRPDIKCGNFSKEEEETIISLHQFLGNKWSAIAARLENKQ